MNNRTSKKVIHQCGSCSSLFQTATNATYSLSRMKRKVTCKADPRKGVVVRGKTRRWTTPGTLGSVNRGIKGSQRKCCTYCCCLHGLCLHPVSHRPRPLSPGAAPHYCWHSRNSGRHPERWHWLAPAKHIMQRVDMDS